MFISEPKFDKRMQAEISRELSMLKRAHRKLKHQRIYSKPSLQRIKSNFVHQKLFIVIRADNLIAHFNSFEDYHKQ